ncbi:MAG: metallopeptidase family protein [Coriobacteriia bacterium]|nr:metallopeptidase family protein [Coriobacteriia bacterium]MBS5478593.1 metallopeptidase family protein [Coriobacteriia bacterium]
MFPMTDDEFEAVISEALDEMPERFVRALDNVGIAMQDEPDDDQLDIAEYGTSDEESGELLGLYEGLPLTERGVDYGSFGADAPDVITIFKGPHERSFDSRAQIVSEIKKTVIHEIGHYFGLDEEQLHAMGY